MQHIIQILWSDGDSQTFEFTIVGIMREFAKDLTRCNNVDCIVVTMCDGEKFRWTPDHKWVELESHWTRLNRPFSKQ